MVWTSFSSRTLFCPFELFLAAGAGEQNRHPLALSLRTTSMKAAVGEPAVNRKREDHPIARKKQAYSP